VSAAGAATGNKQVRFGLAGLGRIGTSHLEAMSQVQGATLAAIIEPRAAVGSAVSEQKQVPCFADYAHPELPKLVDAVVICTPPNLHHGIVKHFLERGIHVLCEKPLTLTSHDAEELAALASAKGLVLMMASKFRYVDDIIKAKAIMEAGILGRIVLFENTFCGKVMMKDRWNANKAVSGGGVLIDNGTHSVDVARYLLGPIQEIQAQNGLAAQALDVEDTVRVQFRTRAGVMGMIDLSWSINKDSDVYVNVYGSEGTLLIGWAGSRYRQDGNAKWVPFGTGYDKTVALRRQLENFVACLSGKEAPLITPQDALASVKAIEAAYASAGKNHWQAVGV